MQPDLVANRAESERASWASITGNGKEAHCFALCSFFQMRGLTDFASGETIVYEVVERFVEVAGDKSANDASIT